MVDADRFPAQFSGWAVFLKGNWASDTFVTNYFPLMFFPVLYAGSWFWYRGHAHVHVDNMDFKTGLAEIEAATYDEPPPRNWVERVWGWVVRIRLLHLLAGHRSLTTVSCSADVKSSWHRLHTHRQLQVGYLHAGRHVAILRCILDISVLPFVRLMGWIAFAATIFRAVSFFPS